MSIVSSITGQKKLKIMSKNHLDLSLIWHSLLSGEKQIVDVVVEFGLPILEEDMMILRVLTSLLKRGRRFVPESYRFCKFIECTSV